MINTILFDFDGTLVDSETIHFQCWQDVLTPYGIIYDEIEFCRQYSGRPTLASAAHVVELHNLDMSAASLAQQKNDNFAKAAASTLPPLMPFAKEVISLAKEQGYNIGLVTGSTRDEVMPILQGYDLLALFSCVVTKDDVSSPKPHPQPYLLGLERLNAQAKSTLAIEDTYTGLCSAAQAGLVTAVVPNKHTEHQDFSQADYRFDNLEHLYTQLLKPA